MAVLVTGGAGYIGSHMAHCLCDAGEHVVIIDNLSTGYRDVLPSEAIFEQGDVSDTELVRRIIQTHKISDVLHFAGSIVVPESVTNPLKYYVNNTSTSCGLIDVAVKEGITRFIFSSTAAVYGTPKFGLVSESSPTEPQSPYGMSKLMTERMLRDVAAVHTLRYGVLRYFNVAGADPKGRSGNSNPEATHLIKIACKVALGQLDSLDIFGTDYPTPDGTGLRDYIHVSDLVDAHFLLLNYLRDGGDSVTLNCGYGRGYSVRNVIEVAKSVTGCDFPVQERGRRSGDPASVIADSSMLAALLKWTPRYDDLRLMIQTAYAWEAGLAEKSSKV